MNPTICKIAEEAKASDLCGVSNQGLTRLKLRWICDENIWQGCSRGVMVKAMDCVLQSRYYVHFRVNTLGKGMNPLILPAMG